MKMLVVCSDLIDDLKSRLVWGDWKVIWVRDAKAAIARVRRERFHLTLLISTGAEMDITETLLNLRDIRSFMPIIVVSEGGDGNDELVTPREIVPLLNTKVLPLSAVAAFVSTLSESRLRGEVGVGFSFAGQGGSPDE
jgi:RNase P/RNase MRP subunit p30